MSPTKSSFERGKDRARISVVIPCYFNQKNVPLLAEILLENEARFPAGTAFEYVMVDDGSGDGTFEELRKFHDSHPDRVKVIKLIRNFGANNAILAGLTAATGDCAVILAADLQDPPELIPQMFEHWKKGMPIVIANRAEREDPWLQKMTSQLFHAFIRRFALPHVPPGGFDLILMDREVREHIVRMNEKNTWIPYLILWLGYPYVSIPYVRRERTVGKSGWTFSKKVKSFIDSVTAFSFLPIRLMSVGGLVLGGLALAYALMIAGSWLLGNPVPEGWSSLMVVFLFLSSFQLMGLGIIGEYLWRTLEASRSRPNFVVETVLERRPATETQLSPPRPC